MMRASIVLLVLLIHFKDSVRSRIVNRTRDIIYTLDTKFSPAEKNYIEKCILEISSRTCLVWKDNSDNSRPVPTLIEMVRADEPAGCKTVRRSTSGAKTILSPHCFQDRWVMHELLHALGFDHEHQRTDRDCYVEVHSSKWNDTSYSINGSSRTTFPYDVNSVMHYRRGPFLRPAEDYPDQEAQFGSKDVLSEMDVWKINNELCRGAHFCQNNKTKCDEINALNQKKGCIKQQETLR